MTLLGFFGERKSKPAAQPAASSQLWTAGVLVAIVSIWACSPDGSANQEGDVPSASTRAIATQSEVPRPPPLGWVALIGEYGSEQDVWLLREDGGRLQLRHEETAYALEERSPGEFIRLANGAEASVSLVFTRGGDGRVVGLQMGATFLSRRAVGTVDGETFRIDPVWDVEELRVEALAASPPLEEGAFRESELVDLTSLDPTIRLDVRYATTNNFMSAVFYEDARAFLQRPATDAVVRAGRALLPYGYGLLIHDGYRPWYVTKMFWDATPTHQREFVANPASGSRHNRGAAVDLSLYDLETGASIEMPGSYDEFSHRSYSDYEGGTSRQRWHRDLLRRVMEAQGFTVNSGEWWHFDHREWTEYGIQNEIVSEIGAAGAR
jgi:D-alanyl-D-alanine dipeptidase